MLWLPEEIDFLNEKSGWPIAAIAKALGRSSASVRLKAHQLRLSLGKGASSPWTDREFMWLRSFAGMGEKAVSLIVQRTIGAIRWHAVQNEISLKRNPNMSDAVEEAASIMEHDGGWPRHASEAMSAAIQYLLNRDNFHVVASDWLKEIDGLDGFYDREDPLATQVALAEYAFDAVGTLDAVKSIDRDLYDRFKKQIRLWKRAKTDDEREEHAGGMTRGYLVLAERILTSGNE